MVAHIALQVVGAVLAGASLLALELALLTNRNRLGDRVQQREEENAAAWTGPVSLRHSYFKRFVRRYAIGLVTWGAFYPGLVLSFWLDHGVSGVFHLLPGVAFLSMIGVALAPGFDTAATMAELGLPLFTSRFRRIRSCHGR